MCLWCFRSCEHCSHGAIFGAGLQPKAQHSEVAWLCTVVPVVAAYQNSILGEPAHTRLGRGADDRKSAQQYLARAHRAITLKAAAQAWACGVPAIQIAEKAIEGTSRKPKPFPKVKAKGKPKAKLKAGAAIPRGAPA